MDVASSAKIENQTSTSYHESISYLEESSFIEKFGAPDKAQRIGGGDIAEVFTCKDLQKVIKFFPSQHTSKGIAEAIAFGRITKTRKTIGPTPISSAHYEFKHGGVMIATQKVRGTERDSYLRELRDVEAKLAVDRSCVDELARTMHKSHKSGIAINDVKLDSLLIAGQDKDVDARIIDLNGAIIIPEISQLVEAISILGQLDIAVAAGINGAELYNLVDQKFDSIAHKLGFTNTHLNCLRDAESLDKTYQLSHHQQANYSRMSRTITAYKTNARAAIANPTTFIHEWYNSFQEECNLDWQRLINIIEEKTDLWTNRQDTNRANRIIQQLDVKEFIQNRIDLLNNEHQEGRHNLSNLHTQLTNLDEIIVKSLLNSIEDSMAM